MNVLARHIFTLLASIGVCFVSVSSLFAQSRDEAILASQEGRVEEARAWYDALSSKKKQDFDPLSLSTLFYIQAYDLKGAERSLGQLRKIRLKDPAKKNLREGLESYYGEVERLLSNTRTVEVWDTVRGRVEDIIERVGASTQALGRITEDSYTSPNGQIQWRVGNDSVPAFLVVHRLGDGRWDEANAEVVEVRGLPEGAMLGYPWLMSDGNTLYFTIEEQGALPTSGLGGKDIYVSRYDREKKILMVPQLLPMPFNSPSDDFLYITNEGDDMGWCVTTRGLMSGEAMLYIFKPSSIQRHEGENVDEVAIWREPVMIEGGVPAVQKDAVVSLPNERVYFWMGKQPICGEKDLKKPGARALFRQYVSTTTALEELERRLCERRERVADNPQEVSRWRDELLNMEERVEVLRAQVGALRNEVIRAEQELNQ